MSDLTSLFSRAQSSSKDIASLSIEQRLKCISKFREVVLKESSNLVSTISNYTHKDPFEVLSTEIFPTLGYCQWLEKNATSALKPKRIKTPIYMFGKTSKILYSPKGVALIISPWNFPFYLTLAPVLTAFTSGNSVIIKPSEHTPFEGMFEKLFTGADFPKDSILVCYGDGSVAEHLIDLKPDIVLFTGNTSTGTKVAQKTASLLIPTVLELGGKDALVVCSDAPLAKAARGAVWGSYANSGQVCTSTENIFIEESVYDKFKSYFDIEIKKIKNLNFIFLEHHRTFLKKMFEIASSDPNTIVHGDLKNLYPSYTENLSFNSSLVQKEVFGPLVNFIKFKDDLSLIDSINNLGYGLAASIWTRSSKRRDLYLTKLKVASMSINNAMITHEHPALPFGGIGKSGYGRYKGIEGLRTFSNQKSIVEDRLTNLSEPHWFPYTQDKFNLLTKMLNSMFSSKILDKLKFLFYALRFFSKGIKN